MTPFESVLRDMPDIANDASPDVAGKLEWVGMNEIEVPVRIEDDAGNLIQSTAIVTAYVIYRDPPGADNKKTKRREKNVDVRIGMKIPVAISASGKTVTARIPKKIDAYCFLLIDENNYQTFSDIQLAR